MAKKYSRRMSKKHRTTKRKQMRSRRHRNRQRGGESAAASVGGDSMKQMSQQSLSQGQQYLNMHQGQHGGGLDAGPFPGAVTEQALIPDNMMGAARVAPLNAALNAIANMKDPGQAGGARRRKGRKASKKAKKASRKSRKGRKGGKTRKMRGGAAYDSNPAPFNGPSMLLDGSQMKAALSGMNSEWKLAENPKAFAPGV
jgi:hypothetical protein